MKHETFVSNHGEELTAGQSESASLPQAATPDAQRVVFRVVGLNALLVTKDAHDTVDVAVDVIGLDSAGVKLGSGEVMHPHEPLLVVAADGLADSTMGSTPTPAQRESWKLHTSTTDFRFWPLAKKTWSIDNIVGPNLALGVYGAVPLKRLNQSLTTLEWTTKAQASARMKLTKGRLTDDIPRDYGGWERRTWVFTNTDDTFEQVAKTSLPVQLTDTIRIELDATSSAPATFTIQGVAPIVTKGPWVEAYLLTLPHALLDFEKKNPLVLHHVTAAYHLFDNAPLKKILPKTGPGPAGAEPVFCPPVRL